MAVIWVRCVRHAVSIRQLIESEMTGEYLFQVDSACLCMRAFRWSFWDCSRLVSEHSGKSASLPWLVQGIHLACVDATLLNAGDTYHHTRERDSRKGAFFSRMSLSMLWNLSRCSLKSQPNFYSTVKRWLYTKLYAHTAGDSGIQIVWQTIIHSARTFPMSLILLIKKCRGLPLTNCLIENLQAVSTTLIIIRYSQTTWKIHTMAVACASPEVRATPRKRHAVLC